MTNIIEKSAVQLGWDEVCNIVAEEIERILGLQLPCKVNIMDDAVCAVMLDGCRLPLPNLCQLLQVTQATPEDWVIALPNEGERDVNDIGMELAEKLIGRHLSLTWEEHLITEDSLWLVGVTDTRKPRLEQNCGDSVTLTNEQIQALVDIADCLRRQKDREGG